MQTTMTHAEMMAATDGAAYLWIDAEHRFAKLVRNGRTFARIDRFTDDTFEATDNGKRMPMPTWAAASAWITARATAEVLTSDLAILA